MPNTLETIVDIASGIAYSDVKKICSQFGVVGKYDIKESLRTLYHQGKNSMKIAFQRCCQCLLIH